MDGQGRAHNREAPGSGAQYIDVQLFATLRLEFGVASVKVAASGPMSVREVIEAAARELGKPEMISKLLGPEAQPRRGTIILVRGRNILHGKGLEEKVHPGEEVCLFPPAGGG